MAKIVGGVLRTFATFFYMLDFLCAACILGIYSYFLAKLHSHNLNIVDQWRAVEGLAGAAVIYTMFAVVLTCFLGGISVFAFVGMMFDLLFCGAMIAIAVLVREAAQQCKGTVTTPLGNGSVNIDGAGTNLGTVCKLNLTVLVVACAGALFFLLSFLMQLLVTRHAHKEKRYGPSPANDYTSGSGKKGGFFRRRAKTTHEAYSKDGAEMGTIGSATTAGGLAAADRQDVRPSHDTGLTGSTMQQTDGYNNANKFESANKYETYPPVPAVVPQPTTMTNAGPNIVSSTTTTQGAYYDPYARPTTTGPTGFVATQTDYVPGTARNVDGATNF